MQQMLNALELKNRLPQRSCIELAGAQRHLGVDKARLLAQVEQAINLPSAANLRPVWARGCNDIFFMALICSRHSLSVALCLIIHRPFC